MIIGYLDELTSSGYFIGWAYDRLRPSRSITVSIRDTDENEVAWGLAHRYRAGLADAGIGMGWCEFQIRKEFQPKDLTPEISVTLYDRETGVSLHRLSQLPCSKQVQRSIQTVDALVCSDPTVIQAISQLSGCDPLFNVFIKARGVSAFVRTAYVYVLSRPADDSGLAVYTNLIRKAALRPYDLLAILADSDEFRSRPRSLGAPNSPTFPFHCD